MERGVFIVGGHHQAWLLLPSPPEPSVPAPAMLQLGPSPAPHSPAQPQPPTCPNLGLALAACTRLGWWDRPWWADPALTGAMGIAHLLGPS